MLVKESSLVNYGSNHHFNNSDIQNKRILSYKNGFKSKIKSIIGDSYKYMKHYLNENKTGILIDVKHKNCNKASNMNLGFLNKRISENEELCLHCNPISQGFSKAEKDILQFIKDNYKGEVLENNKKFDVECDIYIPELKLGIEYNGLYWHSELYKDSKFHLNKTNIFEKNDNQLIHIFEDEWIYKQDIVKSRLLNLLNMSERVWARK